MTFAGVKLIWAKRLLRAKYFVVMTDKASVIAFDGVEPGDMTDMTVLDLQQAELKMFNDDLVRLMKRHQQAINKVSKSSRRKK